MSLHRVKTEGVLQYLLLDRWTADRYCRGMKTTIDIPDDLYRRVKAKSALEGRAVREVTVDLYRAWLQSPTEGPAVASESGQTSRNAAPRWFGSLRHLIRSG